MTDKDQKSMLEVLSNIFTLRNTAIFLAASVLIAAIVVSVMAAINSSDDNYNPPYSSDEPSKSTEPTEPPYQPKLKIVWDSTKCYPDNLASLGEIVTDLDRSILEEIERLNLSTPNTEIGFDSNQIILNTNAKNPDNINKLNDFIYNSLNLTNISTAISCGIDEGNEYCLMLIIKNVSNSFDWDNYFSISEDDVEDVTLKIFMDPVVYQIKHLYLKIQLLIIVNLKVFFLTLVRPTLQRYL